MLKTGNINTTRSFSMPHHEKSPEKPQYNMATPPISRQPPPFSSKNFQTPPISINFGQVEPPLS